jgi:hypothetical protein
MRTLIIFLLLTGSAFAADLNWLCDPPTTNDDGRPLTDTPLTFEWTYEQTGDKKPTFRTTTTCALTVTGAKGGAQVCANVVVVNALGSKSVSAGQLCKKVTKSTPSKATWK